VVPCVIDADHLTQAQFDRDIAALDDPDYFMPPPILWAAWGQRRKTSGAHFADEG